MAKRPSNGNNGPDQENPNKRVKTFYEELDGTDAIDIRTANIDTVLNAFPKEWTKYQQIHLRMTIFYLPVSEAVTQLRSFYFSARPMDPAEAWRIMNNQDVRYAIDHNKADNISGLRCSRIICTLIGLQKRIHRQHSQRQCHPELHKQLETLEVDYRMLYLMLLKPPSKKNVRAFQDLPGEDNEARIRHLLEKIQRDPNPASVGGHAALLSSPYSFQSIPGPQKPLQAPNHVIDKIQEARGLARSFLAETEGNKAMPGSVEGLEEGELVE